MTTIAYRDGIMASDTGSWQGEACHTWAVKLARGADGTLFGVAGDAGPCLKFLRWVASESYTACQSDMRNIPPHPTEKSNGDGNFCILKVACGGPVEFISSSGVESYNAPYFAIGSGAPVAFGAMFAGATAEQAIKAAMEHGQGCHGQVRRISHDSEAS